ncbi:hypothetical protein [Kribbella sp. NPDC048915]|uniref:hypothetical protein n=1 Tax=Kribbella sp. NPDC048915 TaxID=3155148 RepID=UPI00340ED9E9
MSALIDKMAQGQELRSFAQRLNQVVPPEQRGASPALTAPQKGTAEYAAFAGVAEAGKMEGPATTPEARKSGSAKGAEKAKGTEQDK